MNTTIEETSITESSLERYEEAVKSYFDLESSEIFHNGKKEHAKIIIEQMFSRAEKSVHIFCKNLLAEVYNDTHLLRALHSCMHRGASVHVLVENEPQAKDFLMESSYLKQKYPQKLSIRQLGARSSAKKWGFNFAVMDAKAVRFEADKEQSNAIASAHNEKLAAVVEAAFDVARVEAGLACI